MRRLTVVSLAVLAVLGVVPVLAAGCGKSDREEASDTVREFLEAANERDAERLCGELVTDAFVQETTFATGEDSRERCRQQLGALRGPRVELLGLPGVRVEGDEATVVADLEIGGERRQEVFELVKQGGDFRIDSGTVGG